MKNLKIKFGLFSLLAVLAVSVFLTSCEQETILDDIVTETIETQETFQLAVPNGMSEEDMIEWLDNLSYDELRTISEASDVNGIESRGCYSWSPWKEKLIAVSCSGCFNPRPKHTYQRNRYRTCYYYYSGRWNRHVEYDYSTYYYCKTYC